jgi:hypothetical protein
MGGQVEYDAFLHAHVRDQNLFRPGEPGHALVDEGSGEDDVGAVLAEPELVHPLPVREPGQQLDRGVQVPRREACNPPIVYGGGGERRKRLDVAPGGDQAARLPVLRGSGDAKDRDILLEQGAQPPRIVGSFRNLLQEPDRTHRVRFTPEHPGVIDQGNLDRAAPQVHENPLPTLEVGFGSPPRRAPGVPPPSR